MNNLRASAIEPF